MPPALLMLAPIPALKTEMLEPRFTVHRLWKSKDPEAMLNEIRSDVQGIISVYNSPVTARLIGALPALEIIAHYGVGYDNVDIAAAKARKVVVTNTPDVLTDDTADIGMGLVLAVMRRMVEGDLYARSNAWQKKGEMPLGRSLRGKTMGIVGLGRIGMAVAKRAEAFGMRIVWHGPRQKSGVAYPHYSDLCNMAEICDALMITCPYNTATHHLIDSTVLGAMGGKGIVVNIARGKVVDEAALIDALESGTIEGAGLDVFENEPHVPAALCKRDNVVLQPHVGSGTVETRTAMAKLVVDNLVSYFDKGETLTAV